MKVEELLNALDPNRRYKRNLQKYSLCDHCQRQILWVKDKKNGDWYSMELSGEIHEPLCDHMGGDDKCC